MQQTMSKAQWLETIMVQGDYASSTGVFPGFEVRVPLSLVKWFGMLKCLSLEI